MNSTMMDKLRNFHNIICMDGTHCTNKKGMDLTIMLIKDDRNAGFPVAFFLTNRLDQQVQEIFLEAVRKKVGEIKPEYFMTDDDPKYYNAWKKAMNNEPKRLLCTWHVVKNWNIQGKAKITDPELKKQMKTEMKKILNETEEERFLILAEKYLRKLEEANESNFLSYLKKYYFQTEDRIKMWAHCYRKNAGINTNMAIESLNNFLKSNQLKRKTRITVEKLLDAIDDLVDFKMWQRVLNIERPNANNYQDRTIIKAHKKAKTMENTIVVTETGFGEFKVKSFRGKQIYNISYNQLCEGECKTQFCRVCKICVHRYRCDCSEYEVRNTMCKHVHLVRMYEERKGTNLVLDDIVRTTDSEQESAIKKYHQEEIAQFIEEKVRTSNETSAIIDQEARRRIEIDNLKTLIDSLSTVSEENFNNCTTKLYKIIKEAKDKENVVTSNGSSSLKRKMEKQKYFVSNKFCKNKQ